MTASTSRRLLLVGALVCNGLFVIWLLLPVMFGDSTPEWARWGVMGTPAAAVPGDSLGASVARVALFLGVMLLAQWAFLRPIRVAAIFGAAARPRWHAIAAIAFVATLLVTAIIATVLEWPDWWLPVLDLTDDLPWHVWLAMLVMWAGWFAVFLVYFRAGDFLERAERVIRGLIRGSCLELLIAIPTHALVYRRDTDDCYCVRGSYTGLVFGFAVLFWAFGPGLVLLFLREKQRRAPILQNLCPQCGATLDPAREPGAPCPGCGRVPSR